MKKTLTFYPTDEDIANAGRFGVSTKSLCLLSNYTRTLWRLSDESTAQEIMSPYRRVRFMVKVERVWQTCQEGQALPLCVRAEIESSR